jgi:lysyl-tRNA synthetase class 2
MPRASPWWAPDIHADRQPFLRARRAILAALRRHLEAQDFIEVETAILQVSPGNEAHLHGFATELEALPSYFARIRLQKASRRW